jgi:hypothetical protein
MLSEERRRRLEEANSRRACVVVEPAKTTRQSFASYLVFRGHLLKNCHA